MVLSAKKIAKMIESGNNGDISGIAVIPSPNLDEISRSGEASVSLRLGRWFLTMRQTSETYIEATNAHNVKESKFTRKHFVQFGQEFVVHPGSFVLASTLEWIKLPSKYSAVVVGKSTLGRRGIIIETAAGVHPGFSGCLTLEIANVGEVPVKLRAGILICQLFFHEVTGDLSETRSSFAGQRKPRLGQVREDPILQMLMKASI